MACLNMGMMKSEVAKSVWATYKKIVEKGFARHFEWIIFLPGLEQEAERSHPQFKKRA